MKHPSGMSWEYSRGVSWPGVVYSGGGATTAARHYYPTTTTSPCIWAYHSHHHHQPGGGDLGHVAKQRSGTKISLKFVRRLSKLLSTSRESLYGSTREQQHQQQQHTIQHCLAEVHLPSRQKPLKGEAKPGPVSRRKILQSLEEDTRDNEDEDEDDNDDRHQQQQRPMRREDSYEDAVFTSSSGEETASESGSTFSEEGERFSRCFLLRSLDEEEEQEDEGRMVVVVRGATNTATNSSNSSSNSYESGPASPMTDYEEEEQDQHRRRHHNHLSASTIVVCNINNNNNCKVVNNTKTDRHNSDDDDDDDRRRQQRHSLSSSDDKDDSEEDEDEECDPEGVELGELRWVSTLGVGGFGRVELVTAGRNNNTAFALKKMKKAEICDDKQQQHILREKVIMASCDSPFIVKLYRTYRDSRYLYMLMEPCLGGELWTILRNRTRFQDTEARFYTACVIKALEYLHDKGILYRDLKPENLLLDDAGYVKLTDFGFSKQLEGPDEKSWTFCGTPEYVAPEIITNKSHDFRADIWSVGILMYELLTGAPPFTKKDNSSAQVYVDILKGMRSVSFPSWVSASAVELIRQLCRLSPAQRPALAVARRYMWFAGFDWEGLARRALAPPFRPKIDGCLDSSNFDNYVEEQLEPAEDFSDWDSTF